MWNWTEAQLTLIRHGQTPSNAEHRYLGRTEEVLSPEGVRQLEELRASETYPPADLVISGPMKRCLQTARILYPETKIRQIPHWTEMDFGAFEGHNYTELQGDPRYQQWIDSNGTLPFPEGESREEFILRCRLGFAELLKLPEMQTFFESTQEASAEAGRILRISAVVHGGTIMALLHTYLGGEYFAYQVANGSGYTGRLVWREEEKLPRWVDWNQLK